MKKYISFLVLAGLILSFSVATTAKAKEGSDDTGAEVHTSTQIDLGKPKFEDIKLQRKEAQDQRQEDRGLRQEDRQEDRAQRQEDRKAFVEKLQTEKKEFVTKLKSDKDAFLADLKAKKEEWKNANAERKTKFCEAARDAFTRRFEFAIRQLEQYQGKVADIIVELKADGKDTASAQASLDLSIKKLADAKAKLKATNATVPIDCKDVTPEQFEKVKVGAREAKDLLKESREALHQSIKDIRNLKGEDTDDDSNHDQNDDKSNN